MTWITLYWLATIFVGLALGCAERSDDEGTTFPSQAVFDLDQIQWQRRPLVLIAPSDESPGLQAQRRIADAHAAGLADRDITVIVVVGETVRVDGQVRRADAGALRQRMDATGETFAVRLVGKDGTVKLRSDEPIAADRLFEVIDAMPMRQAEIRRNR